MMESVSLPARAILSCRCSHRFRRCHHAAVVVRDAEAHRDDFDVDEDADAASGDGSDSGGDDMPPLLLLLLTMT